MNVTMTNVVNNTHNTNKEISTKYASDKNIREYLESGAKVSFGMSKWHDKEPVYTISNVKDLEVSSKGYIIDKGVIKHPKESNDTVYIGRRDGWSAINISFKSLITLVNGYIPKGGLVIDLKDRSKGWIPTNIVLTDKFTKALVDFSLLQKVGEQDVITYDEKISEDILYTRKETVIEYRTEDFKVFSTYQDALEWQKTVDAAKGLAQVVLDNDGGYAIAEKVFLEMTKYHDKPYKHFRDVMDNDDGVVEQMSKEVVKFNEFSVGGEPKWAHLFSGKSYNQDVANEIVEMLSLAREVYENLEGLSKQVVQ